MAAVLCGVLVAPLGAAGPAQAGHRADRDDATTVLTDRGLVQGSIQDGYRTFFGIPFAAAPVGSLRWRSPQPAPPWRGVRDATAPGSRCLQVDTFPNPIGMAEDCLYLNVTTPAGSATRHQRPVVVWVHGGGFGEGAGSDYLPRRMAVQGDVVVVTVNYRVGIFGYFGHPALPGSGTFGLQDQLAALRWVQRNAASFGGNPGNVTLAGQSAGAMSACTLLTTPAAAGLFDRVILQSGTCLADYPNNAREPGERAGSPWTSRDPLDAAGRQTASMLGCPDTSDTLACLRAKPAADLLIHTNQFRSIAYGTAVLPQEPQQALRDGNFIRVPVLAGGNRDEHRFYARAFYREGEPITEAEYQLLLTDAFGPAAGRVADRYPTHAYAGNPVLAWTTIVTDRGWACPTLTADRLLAARVPVYAYEFADREAPGLLEPPPGFLMGASHSWEIGYLFSFIGGFDVELTAAQRILSDQMIGYWTRFAATGNPNNAGLPTWPRFHPSGSHVLALAPEEGGIHQVDLSTEHQCAFWSRMSDTDR